MKQGRFSRWMVVLALALGLLLVYLAKLQWDWLDAFESSERVRAEGRLSRNGFSMKVAIDNEFRTLGRCFSGLGGTTSQLASQVEARRQLWSRSSRWPALLQGVFLVSRDSDGKANLSRFVAETGAFERMDWPASFEALHSTVPEATTPSHPLVLEVNTALPAVLVPAVLVPASLVASPLAPGVPNAEPDAANPAGVQTAKLVLQLDLSYWRAVFFPELMAIFFPPPNFEGVRAAVVDGATQRLVYATSDIDSLEDFGRSDFTLGLVDAGTDGEELPRVGLRPPKGREAMPNWKRPPTSDDHAWFRNLWASAYYSGYWHLHLGIGGESFADRIQAARWRALRRAFGVLLLIGAVTALIFWLARTAQRTARQQVDFIAGVSHEFRTPLAVLSAAGDNLADSLVHNPEQLQEYGRVIQDESLRLREMVENVLHMARQSSPSGKPILRPIKATQLVEDTLARLSRLLEKEAFEVEVELPPERLHILGDAQALQSALVNLISNGLKYGRLARWLRISVTKGRISQGRDQGQDEVRITVEDRGSGIDKEELRHLFDPFFRGRRAREEQIEGSGLGLALVRDVAISHRGRVSVETTLGQGSRFTLHFPLLEAP